MSSHHPPLSKSSSSESTQALSSVSPAESDRSALSAFLLTADSSPQAVFSAQPFESESEFTAFVLKQLETWYHSERNYTEYLFIEVPLPWGQSVFTAIDNNFKARKTWDSQARILRVRMPTTEGHNCIQPWLIHCMGRWVEAGLISWPEYFALGAYVGTALDIPDSPYAQSRKEPDFFFRPRLASALPANAFEVGWSKSGNGLATDRDLLLRGSGGAIQVVVLINWNVRRQSRTVAGTAEVWRLGPYDQPMLVQSEPIFPIPNPPYAQRLEITYGDVFSSALQPGRNPHDILYLDLDSLRDEARHSFGLMNLAPV